MKRVKGHYLQNKGRKLRNPYWKPHSGWGFLRCPTPLARLRAVAHTEDTMYIQWISAVNTQVMFRTLHEQAEEEALVDNGATENFIDQDTWPRMSIGKRSIERPMTVYNVDGFKNKQGKITHYCWLRARFKGKNWLQKFFLVSLKKDSIILGYPFLYTFNSTLDWQNGRIKEGEASLQTPQYKYRYKDITKIQKQAFAKVGRPAAREAIYMWRSIAQEWAREAESWKDKMTLETIPDEYCRHWKVFSEEESKCFPPSRKKNMSIKLRDNVPPVINCKVYSLSWEECVQLQKFLTTKLELGCIKEGPSPYKLPVYFINKKDSIEKCIIMDYQELNRWTVQDNNPLPNIWEAFKNLQRKNLFLKFNIWWGYINIQIKKKDQYKAAFKTNYGNYIPQVMYFGLMNTPPFF